MKNKLTNRLRITIGVTAMALVPTSASAQGTAAPASGGDDEDVINLNPFTVKEARDTGYVATESIVATGFSEEIYKTLMNIQVITEDFMKDLNIQTVESVANYVSSVKAVDAPVSGNISDGSIFAVRGFRTSWNTRNGVRRYALVGTENVARVEVIKGPLTTFFGQQAPGGIVNYVTKQPSFIDEHQATLRVGTNDELYYSLESQGSIGDSDKVAYRVMYSRNDSGGPRDFEYIDRTFIYGGLLFQPTERTQIYLEAENITSLENRVRGHMTAPEGYLEDWANPPASIQQYAIANGLKVPNNPQYAKERDADGNLVLDADGNPMPAVATADNVADVLRDRWLFNTGSWESDMQGIGFDRTNNRSFPIDVPQGFNKNFAGPFSEIYNDLTTMSLDVRHRFSDNFSARAQYLLDDQIRGASYQNQTGATGDGGLQVGNQTSDNDNWSTNLKVELLGEFEVANTRHKILAGAERYYDEWRQFEDRAYTNDQTEVKFWRNYLGGYDLDAELAGDASQRASAPSVGNPTAVSWNPRDIQNDGWLDPRSWMVDSIPAYTRKTGDAADYWRIQENRRNSYYASWTGTAMEGKLTAMAAIRKEEFESIQVWQNSDQTEVGIDMGDTVPAFGAVYEITDGIAIFGNRSRAFNVNWSRPASVGPAGTNDDLTDDERTSRGDPKQSEGFDIGVKFRWEKMNINGAVSYFSNEEDRGNVVNREATDADPRNADGFERVRINQNGGRIGAEGYEIDLYWTPIPQYTLLFSYGFIPDAEVTEAGPNGEFADQIGNRLAGIPEHDLSIWNRYSFIEGSLKGLSLGLGFSYQSDEKIGTGNEWEGYYLGGYTTVDAMASYVTDAFGPNLRFALNARNLTDKEHYQSAWVPLTGRTISLTTSVRF